jgi:23S rRNA pseudouridine2605 synthase
VVTQLGSKADAARDHIRVDGKLLHGAERHRYFMLNKPRGYVTTMSDPEGRPTVMEFFAGARERVYPVGRLDYLSEGLLLMTNDGELANLLTKAGSGVEKTYLVKVAGEPTAEELERLRGGVAIEKGEPGSERVRTAPARIRQVREGDNPWFEVALIEGRNRELRKMFSAIGHFAEKIRRVGYGPLVLDLEPGKIRELDEDEVKALRLTAEGKMKPRRIKATQLLPKEAGVPAEQRAEKRGGRGGKDFSRRAAPRPDSRFARPQGRSGPSDRRMERPGAASDKPRWNREDRGPKKEWRPRSEEPRGESRERPSFRPAMRQEGGENRFGSAPRGPFKPRSDRPSFRPAPRQDRGEKPFGSAPRAPFKPRTERPEFRPAPRQERGERPIGGAQRGPFKPRGERPFGTAPRGPFKPRTDRPQWKRDDAPKPRLEVERVAGPQKGASFGGGKPKPSFRSKPGFGGKPDGSGKYRGNTRGGPKRSFSRPGAPRGGRKRG